MTPGCQRGQKPGGVSPFSLKIPENNGIIGSLVGYVIALKPLRFGETAGHPAEPLRHTFTKRLVCRHLPVANIASALSPIRVKNSSKNRRPPARRPWSGGGCRHGGP